MYCYIASALQKEGKNFPSPWSCLFSKFIFLWLNFEGELETTLGELEENNRQLATLKAERDSTKGATFPVLNFLNNKPVDRARDKQKDLQDMESTLKELTVLRWLSLFG